MPDLTIGLFESKKVQNRCRVVITCSPDQKESIEDLITQNFFNELKDTGYVKEYKEQFRVSFVLTDPDKIKRLRAGVMAAFMKSSNLANFNEN